MSMSVATNTTKISRALECISEVSNPEMLVTTSAPISGFLPLEEWSPYLLRHPDKEFAAFMRRGLTHGFRIGFDHKCPLRPAPNNFPSVSDNPTTVDQYIHVSSEVAAGHLMVSSSPHTRWNPIGIIPKPHQPGKFRLIADLSAPHGNSVNDGIDLDLCSLEYITEDRAARLVARYGQGALMAKTDLQAAYRTVLVHPRDQHLIGLEWGGATYQDRALPFGLRSAPKLFTAVGDCLTWALTCEGVHDCVHYLDDFLFWGPPASPSCRTALDKAMGLCEKLGLPVAPDKTVGPTTVITFLGIEIDSVSQELRLPVDKLTRLRLTLSRWQHRRASTKRDLQVLVGLLSHAAAVVRPGRSFIRHLIDAEKLPHHQSHKVRLNVGCRADIAWWTTFVERWNGKALFPNLPQGHTIISDASGSWGCGAYMPESGQWFQIQWPKSWATVNIAVKELLPVVAGAAIWGVRWKGTVVLIQSDNQAVVSCLSSRSSRDHHLSHLLRCLFFFEAHFEFSYRAKHIAGSLNSAADALSRNKLANFVSLCPQAHKTASVIPEALSDLLLNPALNWTSNRWKHLFQDTLRRVLPAGQ